MPVGSETIDIVVETLAAALESGQRQKRRLEDEADGLRELVVQQRAARQEALDGWAKANAARDAALRELAQADGHNKMLRGQNAELQAELKKARLTSLYLPDDWRRTVAENLRAQAILDSVEPQFTAQEMNAGPRPYGRRWTEAEFAEAKAIVEEEAEYQRTARGEPTTDDCVTCDGRGWLTPADSMDSVACSRCQGTGRVLVKDDAPKHLDTAREGATDHAMSLDDDTD